MLAENGFTVRNALIEDLAIGRAVCVAAEPGPI